MHGKVFSLANPVITQCSKIKMNAIYTVLLFCFVWCVSISNKNRQHCNKLSGHDLHRQANESIYFFTKIFSVMHFFLLKII